MREVFDVDDDLSHLAEIGGGLETFIDVVADTVDEHLVEGLFG